MVTLVTCHLYPTNSYGSNGAW
ncbi:hypothetical protein F383_14274 [Gossypium arboreum]|uniref:Uncharacterized protein n=1 Tax=Gossypium arboreum TaxID=29729 RepID=A0A0B0NAS4_GOSAR|nr:hypothetical protein F383_14274 [Gossypium arboreum]